MMPSTVTKFFGPLALVLLAVGLFGAANPGPVPGLPGKQLIRVFSIPGQNHFVAAFGKYDPACSYVVHVVADPGCEICTCRLKNPAPGGLLGWAHLPKCTFVLLAQNLAPNPKPKLAYDKSGEVRGEFVGTYKCKGSGGGGSGDEECPPWDGTGVVTDPKCDIASDTVCSAPDGTPDSRATVGVCEKVEFTTNSNAATWSIDGGGSLNKTSGKTVVATMPAAPGSVTVTVTVGGKSCSLTLEVIDPTLVYAPAAFTLAGPPTHPKGETQGAGMLLAGRMFPLSVSFCEIESREKSGPGSNGTGQFAGGKEPPHDASGGAGGDGVWAPVAADNTLGGVDQAAAGPFSPKANWLGGSFDWVIPMQLRCKGSAGARQYQEITQSFTFDKDSGFCKITKSIASVERTPGGNVVIGAGGNSQTVPDPLP